MLKLIEFIRSIYVAVLFVLLEIIALSYYVHATAYTEARLVARSNEVVGGLHRAVTNTRHFFGLGRTNRALTARIAELEEEVARYEEAATEASLKQELSELGSSKWRMLVASVVSNSVNKQHNYIVLNRGRGDDIFGGMAVTTPEGAVTGYVIDCTERYSIAMSILNTAFRGSGTIEGSHYYGSIHWDGGNPRFVTLSELPKYANPEVGQRVVTTGFESYFPQGMLIGTVEEAELDEVGTSYTVRVRLAADLQTMSNMVLIDNLDRQELDDLSQSEVIRELER